MERNSQLQLIVVDDEPTTCDFLSEYIGNTFKHIRVAGHFYNGLDAWKYMQERPVDCLITDIKMPLLSGLDLAKLVYENHLSTKVIIISGYSDFEYARQGIKYQVSDYLLKPIDYNDLSKVISSTLALVQPVSNSDETHTSSAHLDKNFHIVNKAIEYINLNFQNPISRDDVASALYLSPAYFGRIFKKHTGCSFTEYLTQVRMEASIELLKSNHSVQEIAHMVGYNNIRHFTRTFRAMYGCPPREYRIRHL